MHSSKMSDAGRVSRTMKIAPRSSRAKIVASQSLGRKKKTKKPTLFRLRRIVGLLVLSSCIVIVQKTSHLLSSLDTNLPLSPMIDVIKRSRENPSAVHETIIADHETIVADYSRAMNPATRRTNTDAMVATTVNVATCPVYWSRRLPSVFAPSHADSIDPLIPLNRDRFLLPTLINGPNNQLIGLRESIYIAIRLNRTLIIPYFFKHRSDHSGENKQDRRTYAGHRLDWTYLNRLIPVATLYDFRTKCNNTVDAVFRTRYMDAVAYAKLTNITHLTFPVQQDQKLKEEQEYPIGVEIKEGNRVFNITSSTDQVKKVYSSKKRCAMLPWPFKTLVVPIRKPRETPPEITDVETMEDGELYSEVIRFSRSPPHIRQMAEHFITEVLKREDYLAVHWRYDRDDWMQRCSIDGDGEVTQKLINMCRMVQRFKAKDLAAAVKSKLIKLESTGLNVGIVYIASPLSERKFILSVKRQMAKIYKTVIYTSVEVFQFLRQFYGKCEWLWPDREDIVSTLEMEICSRSSSFIGSDSSSWTKNVILSRTKQASPSQSESVDDDDIFALLTADDRDEER